MSLAKLVFTLQDLHHGWWLATLSDGTQQATLTASYVSGDRDIKIFSHSLRHRNWLSVLQHPLNMHFNRLSHIRPYFL
jgi:hypothetical protein